MEIVFCETVFKVLAQYKWIEIIFFKNKTQKYYSW